VIKRSLPGMRRAVVVLLALAGSSLLPIQTAAGNANVPPGVASLLPATAVLDSGDWGVFDTDVDKTFSGGMRAGFPGRAMSCDSTVGPELRVELKGDTAWEEPPMLDMAVAMHESDIAAARKSLPAHVANLRKTNSGVRSVGTLQEEHLPNGELLYIAYDEDCARHPNGTNTVLRAFARKGATMLRIELWISAAPAEATTLARDMLARFENFDVAAVTK